MGGKFSKWWQRARVSLLAIEIIVACILGIALVVTIAGGYLFNWSWTGLGIYSSPPHPTNVDFHPEKTLWDWLQLAGILAIPVVVALATAWFTKQQTQLSNALAEKQHEVDRAIAEKQQQETALQEFLDKMTELLLTNHLHQSQLQDDIRNISRARTLTALYRLNSTRQRSVLQFLYESNLIKN